MKRINLIPDEVKKVTLLKQLILLYRKPGPGRLLLLGISAFIVFNIYVTSSLLRYKLLIFSGKRQVDKILNRINEAQDAAVKIKAQIEQVNKQTKYTQDKLDVLLAARTDKVAWAGVLERLSRLLPENLWVNKVILNKQTITINGMTFDNEVVSRFMTGLDRSGYFRQTGFNYTRKSELSGRPVVEFEVTTHLIPEKASR